ncbi:MAG: hypothetical protein HOH98_06705 [Flavobacteriaceae bacterium]|jgi:2-oxoisovalerate dehydrogenase E1 component|nr:hypothetical protein [Flavobacteriaceae bacterium]MBT6448817.1 hypothetical protein [Flavobacteriaceae bacterium]
MNEKEIILRAIKVRFFEQQLLKLYDEGHLNGTVHTCIGQELTPSTLVEFLEEGDTMFSNHRGHGHYLSWTNDYAGLMNEIIGNKAGCSGGYGGSQHLFFKDKFFSNGIQAGMSPVAAGYSFIQKESNVNNVSVIFIGDGTLGEGLLYETLNLTSLKNLPLLFVLENNGIAQSTSMKQSFSGSLEDRIKGFGLNFFKSNTESLDHLFETLKEAVDKTRKNSPSFIEVKTKRLMSHSKGDDNRSDEFIENQWQNDLINKYISDDYKDQIKFIEKEIQNLASDALKEEKLKSVSSKVSIINNSSYEQEIMSFKHSYGNKRYNELIRKGISLILDKKGYFIGEDIENNNNYHPKSYGGAFKVSGDLSNKYPNQVMNFPISEALIAGFCNGVSLSNVKCVAEIMFGDFSTLIIDQLIQHTSKFTQMYGHKMSIPFILRTPMGGGRGYGPTHSQSLESIFLGITNVQVVYLNNYIDPVNIYKDLSDNQANPIIILENKLDYPKKYRNNKIISHNYFITKEIFPTVLLYSKPKSVDFLIVTYGGGLSIAIDASEELAINHDILCNTVCFSNLSNPNILILKNELKKSKNIILIEEGQTFNSFGSAITKQLSLEGVDFNISHSFGNNDIIPSSFMAEKELLPSAQKIVNTLIK